MPPPENSSTKVRISLPASVRPRMPVLASVRRGDTTVWARRSRLRTGISAMSDFMLRTLALEPVTSLNKDGKTVHHRSGAFDMDADLAIRRRMLNAYVANRAVLGWEPGGVEVFIRPAIEARLVREEAAEAAVMAWLEAEAGDPASPWRDAAAELLRAIRRGGDPPGKRTGTAAHRA